MQAKLKSKHGNWREVADAARTTVGMEDGEGEPSSLWKTRMLLAEHSPIRFLSFSILWKGLRSWISVHIVRHKFGIEHFVRSQRTDRTGINRDKLPQDSLVDHRILANAQALITISRKRLCKQASPETREAWKEALETIKDTEPELYNGCVPDCIYRGWCYELNPCGYYGTPGYKSKLEEYRKDTKCWCSLKINGVKNGCV